MSDPGDAEGGGGGGGGGGGDSDDPRSALLSFIMNELVNPVSKQIYDVANFEFMDERETLIAALVAAIEGDRLVDAEAMKDTRSFDDLLFCEDVEFAQTFRVTRKTVRILVADLKGSGYRPASGELAAEHLVLLLLWYLGSVDRDLAQAARTFSLGGAAVASSSSASSSSSSSSPSGGGAAAAAAIADVAAAVAGLLPELAGVVWPSTDEMRNIEYNLARRHKFPSLVGLLGFFLFIPRPTAGRSSRADGGGGDEVVALQAVVDDSQRFRHLHAVVARSQDEATPASVLVNSPLMERLKHPDMEKFHLLAGSAYPQWGRLLTPFVDDGDLLEDERRFNKAHDRTMENLRTAFSLLLDRFPKLGRLDLSPSDCMVAILASAVIHNYCLLYHDVAAIA